MQGDCANCFLRALKLMVEVAPRRVEGRASSCRPFSRHDVVICKDNDSSATGAKCDGTCERAKP